jgi:hypothetical protein
MRHSKRVAVFRDFLVAELTGALRPNVTGKV